MNTKRPDPIVVGVQLEGEVAEALDAVCGVTLDSRAGFVRRALVNTLRQEGYMPAPETPRRHRGRRRSEATQ